VSFTDADLIARVLLREDQHAFSELVRRYQSPVRGFLLKMTNGDAHRADDLAQEAFVKVWKKLGTFRSEGKFSTWLFGIAHNEWRMSVRGRKEFALEEIADPPTEAEQTDDAAASHLRLDLAAAMKTLTPAERAAIVLCCQNGLSHDEAAQVLECPLGTVKTNVLRGKEKLRRRLAV
jgi:RNA polymerase sigma-70 factor (ECF subfamily)